MRHRVSSKQPNSRMCLVCGLENQYGLKASFFELESNRIISVFDPTESLQGYPGRLHGGIATTVLDETIGRAIMISYGSDIWGVTLRLEAKFRCPVPLDQPIRTVGEIEKEGRRQFTGNGQILLADGTVAVEATGKYLKLPIDEITDFNFEHEQWSVKASDDDPEWFDF